MTETRLSHEQGGNDEIRALAKVMDPFGLGSPEGTSWKDGGVRDHYLHAALTKDEYKTLMDLLWFSDHDTPCYNPRARNGRIDG